MIVLDANLLLYAYDTLAAEHAAAHEFIQGIFAGEEWIGLPWQTVLAFLRISTNSRLSSSRLPMEKALSIAQEWIELRHVRLLVPGERHWDLLQKMLLQGRISGPSATDAALAAVTLEYGGVLYTSDRGFARFPGLRWINPLQKS